MTRLTVASWNIGDGPDSRKWDGLRALDRAGAQVICLQEGSDRKRLLTDWSTENGFRYWPGDGTPGAAAVPLLLKRGVPITRRGTRQAVPAGYVGPGNGNVPEYAKRKVVNWARIEGFGAVMNTHMIPSATGPYPRRKQHYHDHIAVLTDMIERRHSPEVVVGDFNAPPSFQLLYPLRATGARNVVHSPTHKGRVIDLAWLLRCTATLVRVLDMPSDHRAVVVTVKAGTP